MYLAVRCCRTSTQPNTPPAPLRPPHPTPAPAGSTDTSLWTHYKAGAREYCGNAFPDGMRKNDRLAANVITPTTKAEDHDVPISPREIVEQGLMTQEEWDTVGWGEGGQGGLARMWLRPCTPARTRCMPCLLLTRPLRSPPQVSAAALQLFAFGQEQAAKRGLLLVDTKYEFGKVRSGKRGAKKTPWGCSSVAATRVMAMGLALGRLHQLHPLPLPQPLPAQCPPGALRPVLDIRKRTRPRNPHAPHTVRALAALTWPWPPAPPSGR